MRALYTYDMCLLKWPTFQINICPCCLASFLYDAMIPPDCLITISWLVHLRDYSIQRTWNTLLVQLLYLLNMPIKYRYKRSQITHNDNPWYWRYVFRLGNLLNIVEKVTGIDYFCYDIQRTPKVWTSWLEINYNSFKLETWNGNAFKLETSQSPKYSERKYCLLAFSFGGVFVVLVPNGDMVMMIIRESVVRTSQCFWKTAQFELCFGEDLLKLC